MASDSDLAIKRTIHILQAIYAALFASQLVLTAAFIYVGMNLSVDARGVRDFFPFAVLAVTAFNIVGGTKLFQSRLEAIEPEALLDGKLSQYRQASVFRYGLLKGGTIFNGIAYLVLDNALFLVMIAVVLSVFVYYRPREAKLMADLQLNPTAPPSHPDV